MQVSDLLQNATAFAVMKLLLVNANTSEFVTDKVRAAARAAAAATTYVDAVTGRFGARVIATRTELAIAEHATLDLLAEHAPGHDAVLIAVSYDVALWAAREMLSVPVLGITEAALLTACMLGTRIGVIVFGSRVLPIYQERVLQYGLASRVAGWRAIDSNAPYAAGDQSQADALVLAAAHELVAQAGAEVIVLAGAVMADVPARLQSRVAVPLLEGVACGVRLAETLVSLAPAKASVGSLAALPPREVTGLSPALTARFQPTAHRTEG
jgi:allantoin racemase